MGNTQRRLYSMLITTACCLTIPMMTCLATGAVNVDTGQTSCFSASKAITCASTGRPFHGQDAQYQGDTPSYRDNGNGTVTDLNTGLMWQKGLDGKKVTPEQAEEMARNMTLGGYRDWRVPNIKELYSLIDFRGNTGSAGHENFDTIPANAIPFINTDYFDFAYGSIDAGERYIDAQWLSATHYVSTTMEDMDTVFGVNFADGRIKGYGYRKRGTDIVAKTFFVRFVRGNKYGDNDFTDNGDGTITDKTTGLMWMQTDNKMAISWQEALTYGENLDYAGFSDWRLPNAKELQYIVDYSRSPDTTGSPAIAPVFKTSSITNEAGRRDYPYFWTSTTHLDGPEAENNAAYVAFGRAIGQMHGKIMDVHGAGAQRSDQKVGSARLGGSPQGDARRGKNYVRCVRGGITKKDASNRSDTRNYPNTIRLVDIEVTNVLKPGPRNIYQQPDQGHNQFFGERIHLRQNQDMNRTRTRPGPKANFIKRLDRDGDGRVSRREFDGPPNHFTQLDRNHNGYLSEEEAPQGPPPGRIFE